MWSFNRKQSGFTLMEVMVALAVFAAAASLLLLTDGNSTRHTRTLNEKVMAAQLAENHLSRLLAVGAWPESGEREQLQAFAERRWYLRETVSTTNQAQFRQVEVSVYIGDQSPEPAQVPLAQLTTFLRGPAS